MEKPLSEGNLDNWLGTVVDSLSTVGHALGVRFKGSEHDMARRVGATIREALTGTKVPPVLCSYLNRGGEENFFSAFVACLRDKGEHTPDTDFKALARLLSFRQKTSRISAYIDLFRAQIHPVSQYSLPKEVLGLCLINGLASDRIRDMTLHLMSPEIGTDRLPLGEEFDVQRVTRMITRAELMVGALETPTAPARARDTDYLQSGTPSTNQPGTPSNNQLRSATGRSRFRQRGGNRGNARGRGGHASFSPVSGSNATRALINTIAIPWALASTDTGMRPRDRRLSPRWLRIARFARCSIAGRTRCSSSRGP